jgi:hypothetical protein
MSLSVNFASRIRTRAQHGVAMLEFLIVALPLLAAGLGTVEFAHWQLTRQAIDHALMEAVREGAVTHGDPAAMRRRFDAALKPLFGGGTDAPSLAATDARMAARAAAIEADTGSPAMRLEVLGPGKASFADFSDSALGAKFGRRAIGNDYLAEGHAADIARGWPAGRGPASGRDRFEANVLRLRLTYLHPPLLPGVRTLLQALSGAPEADGGAANDTYTAQARARAGMLAITREASVLMQSHGVEWSEANYRAAWGAASVQDAPLPSMGIGNVGNAGGAGLPGACQGGACAPGRGGTSPWTSPWTPPGSPGVVQPGDPACGISVCCGPA